MKRLLAHSILLFWSFSLWASDADGIRTSFFEATQKLELREAFVAQLEGSSTLESTFKQAYLGASMTLLAECSVMPWTKYTQFSEGKDLLEKAIAQRPNEAEFRYLRFLIQFNTPGFLDYNHAFAADYSLIKETIGRATVRALWMDHFLAFERKHINEIQTRL